MATHLI
jgi:hypothetical protein